MTITTSGVSRRKRSTRRYGPASNRPNAAMGLRVALWLCGLRKRDASIGPRLSATTADSATQIASV